MRVLFWADWFLPSIGGVETFSARLLPDLARRGHEITVVAGHHVAGLPDEARWQGITVRRFPFHGALADGDLARTAALLDAVAGLKRELRPDLVHLNTLGPSVLFHLLSARHVPAPVLLTMHSPVPVDAARSDTLTGRGLRSADFVNCNSRAVHAALCARMPELVGRSCVTYYGLEAPSPGPSPRAHEDPIVFGYGRLVRDKGFDLAIRAFAVLAAEFPRARLVLAGDGAARPELEALASELGVAARVRFVGAVAPDRVPGLLDRASIVVVPSRWDEPFGLVALEAALMARPVVAARVGGLAEVVEDGRTGVLVEREDAASLAAAVGLLLREPVRADALGARARARARRRFGWRRCVDAYEELYASTRRGASMRRGDGSSERMHA